MILLDTCVISEFLKPSPSPEVETWIESFDEKQAYLSVLVLGELMRGVSLLGEGSKKSALLLWVEQLKDRFSERLTPFNESDAQTWAALTARMQKQGRKLPLMDSLIAAQALARSAILATRNVADFEGTGVLIVNPWE